MAEAFLASSAVAIGWLLTYLLHSSALIATVWLVTRFMDLQSVTRDFLWKVALVGGVATATAGVIGAHGARSMPVVLQDEMRITLMEASSADAGAGEATWRVGTTGSRMRIDSRIAEPSQECRILLRQGLMRSEAWSARVRDACNAGADFTWFEGAVALWLIGALAGLGMLMVRRISLRDLVASLGEASPRARDLLDGLLPAASTVSVALHRSEMLESPCVLPGGTIVLPGRCERELTDAELRAVLAHELAHVTRRDVIWGTMTRALQAVFWMQPLNWIARTKLAEAAEFTCDDWALARTDEPLELARSISRVAEWMTPGHPSPAVVSMVGRGETGLAFRVRRILSATHPRHERAWLRPLVAVLLLAPLYWVPAVPALATPSASIFVETFSDGLPDSYIESGPGSLLDTASLEFEGRVVERRIIVARLP